MRHTQSISIYLYMTIVALFATMSVTETASAQVAYRLLDLGALQGGTNSFAWAVNSSGQVVGTSETMSGVRHAFLWSRGLMTDLGSLPLGGESTAHDVNDSTSIVGSVVAANGERRAALWQKNVITDLGVLSGGTDARAYGINKVNTITGFFLSTSGHYHAFVWQNGVLSNLPGVGNDAAYGNGINNIGQVVGASNTSFGASDLYTTLWNPNGSVIELPSPFGIGNTRAAAINDVSQVVGIAPTPTDYLYGPAHAILWQNSAAIDLGTLPGRQSAIGWKVNNVGQVIGTAGTLNDLQIEENDTFTSSHAFYWDSIHGMLDLNGLIASASGWVLQEARGINDAGQIVGWGKNSQGQTHAFLLTPLADVSSLVQVRSSGLVYNRSTKLYIGTLTLKNIGSQLLNGPMQAVLTNLTSGVTLTNAVAAVNGAPYLTANISTLAAGATVTLPVLFRNPNNARVSYTVTTYSGSF